MAKKAMTNMSDSRSSTNDAWLSEYRAKTITANAAVADIKDGAEVEIAGAAPLVRAALGRKRPEKRSDNGGGIATLSPLRYKHLRDSRQGKHGPDVAIITVSQPDKNGYCTFGAALTGNKETASVGRLVIAEVMNTPRMNIRTFGDNFIHVREIDRFVENTDTADGAITFFKWKEPDDGVKAIARHLTGLIKDGDTIEVGQGSVSEAMIGLGVFSERSDLGIHSEQMAVGMIDLVRNGNVTGMRKTINRGKHVFSIISNEPPENLEFVTMNPMFEQRQRNYCMDPMVCAQHDNFVAINGGLSVDLLGQITSESVGSQIVGMAGGLPGFVIGATMSKGGRAVTVLPATAVNGTVSRIVPRFAEGVWVTLPYTIADTVITEYGVAELLGKSFRERAEALIAIAHPNFRDSLQAEVATLPWARK